jgi:Tol biopolymer transport system component
MIFSIAGDIWRVNTDGGGLREMVRTTNENGGAASAPDFAPNGRQLAYVEGHRYVVIAMDLAADSFSEIRRIELFDKNPLTPTGADNFDIGPVAVHWSPDGTQLLVTRQRLAGSGMSDVLLMSADGSGRKTLLQTSAFIEARWSISRAPVQPSKAPNASIVVVDGEDG